MPVSAAEVTVVTKRSLCVLMEMMVLVTVTVVSLDSTTVVTESSPRIDPKQYVKKLLGTDGRECVPEGVTGADTDEVNVSRESDSEGAALDVESGMKMGGSDKVGVNTTSRLEDSLGIKVEVTVGVEDDSLSEASEKRVVLSVGELEDAADGDTDSGT